MPGEKWLDVNKARIMLGSALGITLTAMAITWRVATYVGGESAAQASRFHQVQAEIAAGTKAQEVHVVQFEAFKDQMLLRLDMFSRDQARVTDDIRRLEASTANELREVRADIRALPQQVSADGKKE